MPLWFAYGINGFSHDKAHIITIVENDYEIIFMTILPLRLIQERQLSVTGTSMCT